MCVVSLFLLLPVLQPGAAGVLSKSAAELLPPALPWSLERMCIIMK